MMNRRTFLRRALKTGLAMPLLGSLGPMGFRTASANPGGYPTRFLVFFTPNGTNPDSWFPTPGIDETDFSLTPMHAPLEPFKSEIMYLRGVDMKSVAVGPGEPHQQGMGGILTGSHLQAGNFVGGDGSLAGWSNGTSVDQTIANAIGTETPRKSLELGLRVLGSAVRHRLSYKAPAQPLPPIVDPHAAWTTLFSELSLTPSEALAVQQRRQSILDAVHGQFVHVRPKLSTQDLAKLDTHREMVRDLEKSLSKTTELGANCAIPAEPANYPNPQGEQVMDEVMKQQIDLLVMTLACDITRVASLQCSSGANNIRFPFLSSYADDHSLSHAGPSDSTSQSEWAFRQQWYAAQFAYLLAKLQAVPEGDGTLLDHTLVLWCNELGQGNTHSHDDIPFVLAGRAGGAVSPGRYVQYAGKNHNDLLAACAQAMGLTDVELYGDPNFATGVLPGIL